MSKSLLHMAVSAALVIGGCGGSETDAGGTISSRASSSMTVQSTTSNDALLAVTMFSSGADVEGQNNTYSWTATNISNLTLTGVELGSNWADHIGQGPILVSAAPGCGGQSPSDFPATANMGVWCTPTGGVTLAPGASVTGSVTIRPLAGGAPRYNTYALYNDPLLGGRQNASALVPDTQPVAPSPVDVQITQHLLARGRDRLHVHVPFEEQRAMGHRGGHSGLGHLSVFARFRGHVRTSWILLHRGWPDG